MNIYCTLDTETFGGASKPKGIYHLGGIIHNRKGEILGSFNYLIMEHYGEIKKDDYAKKNFHLYQQYVENGITTAVTTEQQAVEAVNDLFNYFNVNYVMAFNSGFDFTKTLCKQLLEGREFIDIWLMALQTICQLKKYSKYCADNNFITNKQKAKTSAEVVYAYLTNNAEYIEEHTAFEDSKIELEIFLACLKSHKKFTKNIHCFDYCTQNNAFYLFPKICS